MKKRVLLIVVLFLVSLIIRLDNIQARTVFLGDQGVIVSELRDALSQGRLPDTGQTHSNGIRLGPVMYHLFALPYMVSGNNPIGIAMFIALLNTAAVMLLFFIGEKMFGEKPAFVVAFLYAVSPVLWHQMPNIWPPALVPFFVLLLISGMVLMHERKNPAYILVSGVAFGVLSQLYAPTFPAVYFLAALSVYVLFSLRKRYPVRVLLFWCTAFIFCVTILWLPYLRFEISRNFEDLRMSLAIMLFPPTPSPALMSTMQDKFGLVRSLFDTLLPVGDIRVRWIVAGIALLHSLFFGGYWGKMIVLWLVAASIPMFLYKGPIFEHYVAAFFIVPFFCLGFILATLHRIWPRLAAILPVFLLLFLFADGQETPAGNDLTRTERVVNEMIRQSEGSDFSFTLLSSPSFSDYHYRYFFQLKGVNPSIIYDDEYPTLYLVCEGVRCPSWRELEKQKIIYVNCYEKLCKATYPDKRLTGWKYKSEKDILGTHIVTLSLEK